jgi:hypothetical protein
MKEALDTNLVLNFSRLLLRINLMARPKEEKRIPKDPFLATWNVLASSTTTRHVRFNQESSYGQDKERNVSLKIRSHQGFHLLASYLVLQIQLSDGEIKRYDRPKVYHSSQ